MPNLKKYRNEQMATPMQKKAVDLILSGKAKSLHQAMKMAGYSDGTAKTPSKNLVRQKGVQLYLSRANNKAMERWNESIQDKVMDVYTDGLDATRLYGKNAVEHPDHMTRLQFADRFSRFFGWEKTIDDDAKKFNQFNFFNVSKEDRDKYKERLKEFLKNSKA